MRRPAQVVIGANYGDEAKGAAVDRLAGEGTIVVRFNGGAQAGHTVEAPQGPRNIPRRHVFHHVGSGSFRGAATYLSRHVVSSPMHLVPELAELRAIGVVPAIQADPRGLLTTPYDMLLNQAAEASRGAARHGSCGYGFGETIERAERGFATTLADAGDAVVLRRRLQKIRDEWVPRRCAELGLVAMPPDYADLLADGALVEAYLDVAAKFAEVVALRPPSILATADVVFEGAQGLALDQAAGAFPHVTRSCTGLRNVLDIAGEAGIGRLDVTYATRCYLTRHGAGPLPYETASAPVPGFRDDTNVPNAWQGTLRFAPLDADRLRARIARDLDQARGTGIAVTPRLAVSCLDQADGRLPLIVDGDRREIPADGVTPLLLARLGFSDGTAAWGPHRDGVRPVVAPAAAA